MMKWAHIWSVNYCTEVLGSLGTKYFMREKNSLVFKMLCHILTAFEYSLKFAKKKYKWNDLTAYFW